MLDRLRARGDRTHVLMLTARDTVLDRITGLARGADDYLVKPFALEELVARVKALTRRSYGVKSPTIRVGDLEIDTASRAVMRGGAEIALQPREYNLFEYLALRKGTVVERAEIERHIYDDRAEPMSNVVDSAICQLRKKIDREGAPSLIQTRRGMGYVLVEPAE
jgi:DNA-binding response OmpR family regulator